MKTLIRLLQNEESDLGLHYLHIQTYLSENLGTLLIVSISGLLRVFILGQTSFGDLFLYGISLYCLYSPVLNMKEPPKLEAL